MPDDVQLQLLPGSHIALISRGALMRSVSAMSLALPPVPPADGAALWRLLPEPVRRSLAELHALAPAEPLALWLDVQLRAAANWPWELLTPADQPGALPFALRPQLPLARYLAAGPAQAIRPGTLRVLAIAATPGDQPTLDGEALLRPVAALHGAARITAKLQPRCSPDRLRALLGAQRPDVLIVAAHGEPGALLLEDARGESVPLDARDLASMLVDSGVRAVVLASCDGATPLPDARSTAEVLLQAGALGVVAMNGPISAQAAGWFLDGLLPAIAAGLPLEQAVVAGRQKIVDAQGVEHGEWHIPVCWQRALHRPLVLPPAEAVRQGAKTVTAQAVPWAKYLATGGTLGLLAVCSLQSLLLPTTIAVPAALALLEGLGLNVFAGYLGDALGKVWKDSGGARSEATRDELAQALQQIVYDHADAAAQLAALAESSGAVANIVAAIRQETTGSRALLEGIERDLGRHGAALAQLHGGLQRDLAGISGDLRAGLRVLFGQLAAVKEDTGAIRADVQEVKRTGTATLVGVNDVKSDTEAIREKLDEPEREQQRRVQTQLAEYLQWVMTTYQRLRLSRFIDERRGSEDDAKGLYLQDVYTALTTEVWRPVPLAKGTARIARTVRKALRFMERRSPQIAPPLLARRLGYLWNATDTTALVRPSTLGPSEGREVGLLDEPLPEDVDDARTLFVRYKRPELVTEAMAPRNQLGKPQRLVLLGDPGSGKSTVLRYVSVLLAQAWDGNKLPSLSSWSERRIPIVLSLGNLGKQLLQDPPEQALWDAIENLLRGTGKQVRPDLPGSLHDLLPDMVLLLDGLDELSAEQGPEKQPGPRQCAAKAISRVAADLPHTPIIVTSRVLPYRASPPSGTNAWLLPREDGWDEREVQHFAFGQVRQFVRDWYEADARAQNYDPEQATARANDLLQQLEDPALRRAITPGSVAPRDNPPASPLLLTMLAVLHANLDGRALPRERDELYEALVTLLLHRWEPRRSQPDYVRDDLLTRLNIPGLDSVDKLRTVLHEIAFNAHRQAVAGGDGRGVLKGSEIRDSLITYFLTSLKCHKSEVLDKVQIFLDVLQTEAGLLMKYGDDAYALPHLTFQEYLAACYLADQAQDDMVELAYPHWCAADAERWRVALLLLMGRLKQDRKVAGNGYAWVTHLAEERDIDNVGKSPPQRQRDALFAAECYDALGRQAFLLGRKGAECEKAVRDALRTVVPPAGLRADALHLKPAERARAAVALARLSNTAAPADLRPGVCALPQGLNDAYWCAPFAAGNYPIADGKATVQLAEFRIARYPVTVWQYKQFVEAKGYEQERWWTKAGWKWLQPGSPRYNLQEQERITQPYLWEASAWTADNQPVIGVSWYEAVAFCHWLAAQSSWLPQGWTIRLPSEAEWEVAAMWDAQAHQMRPWQPPENELWQNVAEAEIGRTSPVGLFPQGASPCGALDMSGNVWEWCGSRYEDYPARASKLCDDFAVDKFGPALRGGVYYLQNKDSSWGARDLRRPAPPGLAAGVFGLPCARRSVFAASGC